MRLVNFVLFMFTRKRRESNPLIAPSHPLKFQFGGWRGWSIFFTYFLAILFEISLFFSYGIELKSVKKLKEIFLKVKSTLTVSVPLISLNWIELQIWITKCLFII